MLAKRIIPCLDVDNGWVVKGVNFKNLKESGDPVKLAGEYSRQGADELVFLDISATIEDRKTMLSLVQKVAEQIFIPMTVGGGIRDLQDIKNALKAGADKVAVNTAAVQNPAIISDGARVFGSQCIVVAVDCLRKDDYWEVFIESGKKPTGIPVLEWAKKAVKRGAGEILLTSIDSDGTKKGFDIGLTKLISKSVRVPVIASGGAGELQDFAEILSKGQADAALAASLFHFGIVTIKEVKKYLKKRRIPIRN